MEKIEKGKKVTLVFWYDDYAPYNVDNRSNIMLMMVYLKPDKNDPKSMADYHAHKHFYMISTGYAKDEQAFYQALKEVIIRLKKLEDEQNVEIKYMMDGIAFYKFFGIGGVASNMTKYRGVAANVKANPNILTCNSKHEKRWNKLKNISDPNFQHNVLQCANSECDCLDWEIMQTKWINSNLDTHELEERQPEEFTSAYFITHIDNILNKIQDNGGSTSRILTRLRDEGSSRGLPGKIMEKIMSGEDMKWLYDRGSSIQNTVVGTMHLFLLGHGKSGILQELLKHYPNCARAVKRAASQLAEMNIDWLHAITKSDVDGSFAIFQGDEILTLFYFWGFIIEDEKIRRICFLLTAIYAATMENADYYKRQEMSKAYLTEFELLFDHGKKKGSSRRLPTGGYQYNASRNHVNEHNRGIVELQNLNYVQVFIPRNTGRIVNPTLFAMSRPNHCMMLAANKDVEYVEYSDRVCEGWVKKAKLAAQKSHARSYLYAKNSMDKYHKKKAVDGFMALENEDEHRGHYANATQYVDNIKSGDGGLNGKNFISGYFCIENKTFYAKYDKQFYVVSPVSIGKKFVFDLNPEFPVVIITFQII